MTNESTRESVSRTSGIKNFFKRQGRRKEYPLLMEQQCSMLSFFYDQVFGAHLHDGACCFYKGKLTAQFARFTIVHQQHIHLPDHCFQIFQSGLHPEVHGIHDNQAGALF